MRAVLLVAALLVACGPKDDADDVVIDSTPVTPPALTAADVAGTWNYEVRTMASDSVITTGQTIVAPDGMSVTQTATGGATASGAMVLSGDTFTTTVGPYPSALRAGVMVTTTGNYRLVGGQIVGDVTARYEGVTTSDSVVQLRVTMNRAP